MRRSRLAAVLAVLGVVLIATWVMAAPSPQPDRHGTSAPSPTTSVMTTPAAVPPLASGATVSSEPAASSSPTTVAPAPPVSLTVTSTATGQSILSTANLAADIGTYDPVVNNDGKGFQRIDPPNYPEAVWVRYQPEALPATEASPGTTYIYGHACHHHECPFTNLPQTSVDDSITVTTSQGTFTYRVTDIRADLSKDGEDGQPGTISDRNVPNRLVLITCAYENGDESLNNLAVAAVLVSATPAG